MAKKSKKLTENGISTTTELGSENYEKFTHRKQTRYQYDYRHTDGTLFSTVASTLKECRSRRDIWLKGKEGEK
jgi:hypothetical protein